MLIHEVRARIARSPWRPSLVIVLLVLWIFFIVYATTLPFDFSASRQLVARRMEWLRAHPVERGGMLRDAVSNVFFFIPYGCLLGCRRAERGSSLLVATIFGTATGALLSGTVEVIQLFSPRRTPSLLDLSTNTLGAFIGAIVGWIGTRKVWPVASVRIRQALVTRPLAGCALVAMIGLLIAGIAPPPIAYTHVTAAHPSERTGLLSSASAPSNVTRLLDSSLVFRDMLTWALAGGLFLMAARESARWRTVITTIIAITAALCLSLTIETLDLALPGQSFDVTSIVFDLIGAAAGVASVGLFSKAGEESRWVTPAIVVWGMVLMVSAWYPWRFQWPDQPYWRLERVVPFWSYFFSRSFADLADVVGTALFFLPLGALLAARSWRQSFAGACAIGLGIALLLEVGQACLPWRTADITDVLSGAAGAGTGLALWRWGVSTRTSSQGSVRYRIRPPTA